MDLTRIKKELESLGIPIPAGLPLDAWAVRVTEDPARNVTALVAAATIAFYLAERRANPKVNDVWDSLVYTSTCLSVGYGDIFPKTPLGKILGAALMLVGPSMAARALDGRPSAPARDPVLDDILETLRKILARLESAGGSATSAAPPAAPPSCPPRP